jgi:HlyD family secretion protein
VLLVAAALIVALYLAYGWWVDSNRLPEGLIQASGRIEADDVTVASKFAGRVEQLLAREGDVVTAGQMVVVLDDVQVRARAEQATAAVDASWAQVKAAESALAAFKQEVPLSIENAEAGLTRARAELVVAESVAAEAARDVSRSRKLQESGTISNHSLDDTEVGYDSARGALDAARAGVIQATKQLDQARLGSFMLQAKNDELAALRAQAVQAEAARDEALSVLEDLQIKAPISGVVMTRVAEVGQVVAAGAALLNIVDLDRLYLKVYVPAAEIGKLRLGLPARVHTDAFPDRPFPAAVQYIASRAEFTPKEVQTPDERVKQVYAVKLYLDENPDHRLTPGLPADAMIQWLEDAEWTRPRW